PLDRRGDVVNQLIARDRFRLRGDHQRRPLDLRQQRQRELEQRESTQRRKRNGGNDDRDRTPEDSFDHGASVATASSVSASTPLTTTRSRSCSPEVISMRPFARPPVTTGTRLTWNRLNDPSVVATTNTAAPSAPATMASSGTVSAAPRGSIRTV